MSCDLSIIVVSYNTRDLTLACLASAHAQTTKTTYELLVVDNNSSDGSAQAIAEQFPDVTLLARCDNPGFARANNIAARAARGDWILLLNPDTVVVDGAIDAIVQFAKDHPEYGIFGGRTLFADGSLNPTSCWNKMTLWSVFARGVGFTALFRSSRLFNPESLGRWRRNSIRQVDIVTGCFLLIGRELWDQLDGFDEQFYMYGEDSDLCLRAAELGARSVICPSATIIHYGGRSEQVRADKVVRLFSAKAQLMRKYWSPAASAIGVGTLDLWALTRVIASSVFAMARRSDQAREMKENWCDVWRHRKVWREQAPAYGKKECAQ